jgi:hypothetical protein
MNTGTGRYVKQAGGYSAFISNPLPPNPPIKLERNYLKTK